MAAVAVILPVRGRPEGSLRAALRLQAMAGDADAAWVVAGGADEADTLAAVGRAGWGVAQGAAPRLTYWQALALATDATDAPILCAVASDLRPGARWLERGLAAYRARFGGGDGLMGFNGDSHGPEHSCHFLIGRGLLAELGGWPTWYDHNFGDTELCARAQALGRYGKAAWALLFHDHPIVGAATDETYREGMAGWAADQALFLRRQREGWHAR